MKKNLVITIIVAMRFIFSSFIVNANDSAADVDDTILDENGNPIEVFSASNINGTSNLYQQVGDIAFNALNNIFLNELRQQNFASSNYVNDYAGSMIDSNGKLIVYMTSDLSQLEPLQNELRNASVKDDDISFVQVKYSYKDLEEQLRLMWQIRNDAINSLSEYEQWARRIVYLAIDPEYNCVKIFANGFNEFDYSICEQIYGDFSYVVEPTTATGDIIEEITLKPGQGISTGGSVGFRCKLNGIAGFVTAVHTTAWSSLPHLTQSGTDYGTITAGVYDGKADFCFVKITNSDYNASLNTNTSPYYTLHASNYVISLPKGYTVYMAGRNSTSVNVGKVTYYDAAVASGTNWILCDYPSGSGDSGGCIFANVNGDYVVVAIHDGVVSGGGKYGTKYTMMKSYYNITIYWLVAMSN